jgi:hypothetical protein
MGANRLGKALFFFSSSQPCTIFNSGDSEDDDEVKDSMQEMKPNERLTMQLYCNGLKVQSSRVAVPRVPFLGLAWHGGK